MSRHATVLARREGRATGPSRWWGRRWWERAMCIAVSVLLMGCSSAPVPPSTHQPSAPVGPSGSVVASPFDACSLLTEADIEAVYEGGDATPAPWPPGGCRWYLHGGVQFPGLHPKEIIVSVVSGNQMKCGGYDPFDGPWEVGCRLYSYFQFFVDGRTVKLTAPPSDPDAGNIEGAALARLVAARLP